MIGNLQNILFYTVLSLIFTKELENLICYITIADAYVKCIPLNNFAKAHKSQDYVESLYLVYSHGKLKIFSYKSHCKTTHL